MSLEPQPLIALLHCQEQTPPIQHPVAPYTALLHWMCSILLPQVLIAMEGENRASSECLRVMAVFVMKGPSLKHTSVLLMEACASVSPMGAYRLVCVVGAERLVCAVGAYRVVCVVGAYRVVSLMVTNTWVQVVLAWTLVSVAERLIPLLISMAVCV